MSSLLYSICRFCVCNCASHSLLAGLFSLAIVHSTRRVFLKADASSLAHLTATCSAQPYFEVSGLAAVPVGPRKLLAAILGDTGCHIARLHCDVCSSSMMLCGSASCCSYGCNPGLPRTVHTRWCRQTSCCCVHRFLAQHHVWLSM